MSNYSQEDIQLFQGLLQELTGMTVDDLKQGVEYVNSKRREETINPLREQWGENFDYYLGETEKYFNSLPEERRAIYNNPEGVEYLFNTHVKNTIQNVQPPAAGQPPGMDMGLRSTQLPNNMQPEGMSLKDINAMSDSERAENWDSIKATFAAQQSEQPTN